jgi:ribosomal protein L37AE/L43A
MALGSWVKEGIELIRRIASLEARVTALEEAQGSQMPDACPKCGERAMRRAQPGRLLGPGGNQWRQDVWKCEKCGDEETRVVRFP